ncbi:MAG: hypothetical protein EOO23_05815 [Comamonadaceae bacterium]|nr:MAG: hypothetical protein EOO23_05815 [Comamonadaceae bacterium]
MGPVGFSEEPDHLDGEVATGKASRRNGYSKKMVPGESAKLELQIPRDRGVTIDPKLIAKYQRRLPGFDETITSIRVRGMSAHEIQERDWELYGRDVPPDPILTVTRRCWRR